MAAPAYKSHSTGTVSTGNTAVSVAAPSPAPAAEDYQFVGLLIASSSITLPATDPSGWVKRNDIVVSSDNAASGTSRVALYELSPTATLAEKQGAFALTLSASRVWAAARGCYTLPAGSTGRTIAIAVLNEALGTGGTSHAVPGVTTTAADSVVVVFGGSDQHSSVGAQSWTGTGTFTSRVNLQGGNATERQAIVMADKTVASPGAVSDTFTTQTADEVGMFSLVLNGVSSTVAPGTVFDLDDWKVTLPTDGADAGTGADEVTQPALETHSDANFYLDGSSRMVMVAPTVGATTSGSSATRYELREMEGGVEAAWSVATSGARQLTVSGIFDPTSITGGTEPRKEIIVGQIHGPSGTPPMYLSVEHTSGTAGTVVTPRLRVYKDGPGLANILSPLTATTEITYRIRVESGRVKLWAAIGGVGALPSTPQYDWAAADFTEDTSVCYFKAGAYNKTTVASGSTGSAIATITHLELLQPADAPAPTMEPGRMLLGYAA